MRASLLVFCLAGAAAFAPRAAPLVGARAAALRHSEGGGGGAAAEGDERKPPPTWGSPEWQWGSASGYAHEAAAELRATYAKRHRRSAFLSWAKSGSADLADLKLALALSCQRARNLGYDRPDGRWGALMERMANVEFESRGMIDPPKLAAAVNQLLATPLMPDDFAGEEYEYPAAVMGYALEELDFLDNGL